jgi:hypothetical protein
MMFNWGIVVWTKTAWYKPAFRKAWAARPTYANSAFFRQAMQHGGHYITEPMHGQFTGKPVVSMLEPLRTATARSWA